MAYNPIANSEIDNGSFWTETLSQKFRDNIEGHNHSEATTTDIVNAGLQAYTAGDYLVTSNDTERSTSSISYIKKKEIKILRAGGYRIKFNMHSTNTYNGYATIYKNGSAIGTERITASETYINYSEDFTGFASGDLIQIYAKNENGSNLTFINDFRVYCAEEGNLIGY